MEIEKYDYLLIIDFKISTNLIEYVNLDIKYLILYLVKIRQKAVSLMQI